MNKPNLFVVGAPRAGTTSLHSYLGEHPEIFMSPIKTPNYFSQKAEKSKTKSRKEYLKLFEKAKNQKYLGESSHYLHLENAPRQIKNFSPNAKIIISLREPSELVASYYNARNENYNKESILRELEERPKSREILWKSLEYSSNIKRFQKQFGKDNVYVIIFERMLQNPVEEFKKVCRFLGIEERFLPEFSQYNPPSKKRKIFYKIYNKIPQVSRDFVKKSLKGKNRSKLKAIIERVVSKQIIKKRDRVLLKDLRKFFSSEIEKTENLIGQKIKEWE